MGIWRENEILRWRMQFKWAVWRPINGGWSEWDWWSWCITRCERGLRVTICFLKALELHFVVILYAIQYCIHYLFWSQYRARVCNNHTLRKEAEGANRTELEMLSSFRTLRVALLGSEKPPQVDHSETRWARHPVEWQMAICEKIDRCRIDGAWRSWGEWTVLWYCLELHNSRRRLLCDQLIKDTL